MSIFAARSRNSYPDLATQYRTVYGRCTSFAYSAAALGTGGNAHTARHAKSGYVVLGCGPGDSAANYAAAMASMRTVNPRVKFLHYVIQTETTGYPEVANTANQAAMLAPPAGTIVGSVTKRTDTGTFWRCTTLPGTSLGHWTDEGATYPKYAEPGSFRYEGIGRYEKVQQNQGWELKRSAANGSVRTSDHATANNNNHGSANPSLDSSGRTWQQWLAEWYYAPGAGLHLQSTLGDYIDGIWMDNCKVYAETSADIDNTGTENAFASPPNADRIAWAKRGHERFARELRKIRPTALLHGNSQANQVNPATVNTFYDSPDLQNLDGGMYEAAAGFPNVNSKTLHGEGWQKMYERQQLLCSKLQRQKAVALTFALGGSTEYQNNRLGICTALLSDGNYTVTIGGNYTTTPPDFDEFGAELGAPIEPAPSAATTGNIWTRKYENGLVIVNGASRNAGGSPTNFQPQNSPATETYTPPPGVYRHITATQDTTANPQSGGIGAVVTGSLTIPSWDGRILLCVSPGVHA